MKIQILTFNDEINFSLQEGDIIHRIPASVTPTSSSSGYNSNTTANPIAVGIVVSLKPDNAPPNSISVIYDDTNVLYGDPTPSVDDYIMFSKNKQVNSSNLKGFYAEAEFVNYSDEEIKLFSVGSEVVESSK